MLNSILVIDHGVASLLPQIGAFWLVSMSAYAVLLAVIIVCAYRFTGWKTGWSLLNWAEENISKKSALWIIASSAALFIGIEIIKRLVGRIRPDGGLFSFPSRHTALAFFLAFVLPVDKKWRVILIIWAALVGLSRLLLAQHWLSDVLVGAGIGVMAGWLVKKNSQNVAALKQNANPS